MPNPGYRHARERRSAGRIKAVTLALALAYLGYVFIDVARLSMPLLNASATFAPESWMTDPEARAIAQPNAPPADTAHARADNIHAIVSP
ncbi:MAG TPA: hypothetical protein VMV45_10595 [Casimicrobiaceae bacterium]|nr:hypothetical protein [Casimicrobiaceae bacterium]